ncbi:MAG: hypothetical protein HY231_12500 [Acidobacteria bacterium]|nr:hypothetical protein [Acidobacteriota bacterium]
MEQEMNVQREASRRNSERTNSGSKEALAVIQGELTTKAMSFAVIRKELTAKARGSTRRDSERINGESPSPNSYIERTPLCDNLESFKHQIIGGASMTNRKYVAFDVHTATIVAVVLDGGGKLMSQAVIKTEATAVRDFLRGLSGEVHLTFEEGTQAQWLYDLTRPLVADLIVCNARHASSLANK